MDSDDAADLVASMPNEQQHEVLSHMEDLEQAGDIVDLLHYDEDTAGGLMAKELVMVNENWTVLTCLREVSRQAENLDEIYNIYVVDDDNKLKGRLSLKKSLPPLPRQKSVIFTILTLSRSKPTNPRNQWL